MRELIEQLREMGVSYDSLTMIREKDGVVVARVRFGGGCAVVKYFRNPEHRREIENYRILAHLGIPTLAVLAQTDRAFLMEDVDASPVYRLGVAEDMQDPEVAVCLAAWYRALHQKGYGYVSLHGAGLYDEADAVTRENMLSLRRATESETLPVWRVFDEHFDEIMQKIGRVRRTLTYNDFYYTNFVVRKDRSAAFMYDYNMFVKGYAYSDMRNVCSSLGEQAQHAFISAYGPIDLREKIVDDVVSVFTTLHFAYRRPEFPSWAEEELQTLRGDYLERVQLLLRTEF